MPRFSDVDDKENARVDFNKIGTTSKLVSRDLREDLAKDLGLLTKSELTYPLLRKMNEKKKSIVESIVQIEEKLSKIK